MKKNYIEAVLQMINAGTDIHTVLKGLEATLIKKGHTRLHGAVLRGVVRILSSKSVTTVTKVTAASEAKFKDEIHAIESALARLHAPNEYEKVVDPTIIGGVIVEHDNVVLDTSYKTKLVKLYRSLTK